MSKILHYQRKTRKNANFSMEFIFEDLRTRLGDQLGIEVRRAPVLSNGLLRRLMILLDLWWQPHPVKHVTGDINFAVLAARRSTSVLTVLDCGSVFRLTGWKRAVFKRIWLDWPVAWANRVTTISEASKKQIVELTGCEPGKVVVTYVAISEKFQPNPREFSSECPNILIIGTAANKNLHRIFTAVRDLPCKLTIVGKLSDALKSMLKELGIAYVNHMNLSQEEVVRRYEESDMLVFASTYEGFGMPILEAQAVGRPVVTSNVCSMPEVAGTAAILVDPYNTESIREAIVRIIECEEERSRLVAEGFQNIKRFDPQTIAEKYAAVYRELL